MKCHICSGDVTELRSVMIRQWRAEYDVWGVTVQLPAADTPAYAHYCKNMTYRRAFICESCYRTIDAHPGGCAEVPGFGEWNLAGQSRAGAAAIFARAKWERFQRSKGSVMGIEW